MFKLSMTQTGLGYYYYYGHAGDGPDYYRAHAYASKAAAEKSNLLGTVAYNSSLFGLDIRKIFKINRADQQ